MNYSSNEQNFVHSCVNPVELDPTGWKETEQGHAGPNEAKCGRKTKPNGAELGHFLFYFVCYLFNVGIFHDIMIVVK